MRLIAGVVDQPAVLGVGHLRFRSVWIPSGFRGAVQKWAAYPLLPRLSDLRSAPAKPAEVGDAD